MNPHSGTHSLYALMLLKHLSESLLMLNRAYQNLNTVLNETCSKLDLLMSTGLSLQESLKRFADDQAVRLLTIHKSKGLEFHSVIMLGIEEECYWGNPEENLCVYFVGISRAKQRLLLTHSISCSTIWASWTMG